MVVPEGDGAARPGALRRREVGVPGVGAVPRHGAVPGQQEQAAHAEPFRINDVYRVTHQDGKKPSLT